VEKNFIKNFPDDSFHPGKTARSGDKRGNNIKKIGKILKTLDFVFKILYNVTCVTGLKKKWIIR
jgi:hypothetical protein